jgi:hypothetical protein
LLREGFYSETGKYDVDDEGMGIYIGTGGLSFVDGVAEGGVLSGNMGTGDSMRRIMWREEGY